MKVQGRAERMDYGFARFLNLFLKKGYFLYFRFKYLCERRTMRLFCSCFKATKLRRKSILSEVSASHTFMPFSQECQSFLKENHHLLISICVVQKGLLGLCWPRNGDRSVTSFHCPGNSDWARGSHMTHINPIQIQAGDFCWKQQERQSFPENEGTTEKSRRSDGTLISSFKHLNPAMSETHTRFFSYRRP